MTAFRNDSRSCYPGQRGEAEFAIGISFDKESDGPLTENAITVKKHNLISWYKFPHPHKGIRSLMTEKTVVVFDIGGVLIRINRNWQQASKAAGVSTTLPDSPVSEFDSFPEFGPYQNGKIDYSTFCNGLARFLGCSTEDANKVFKAILADPIPGTHELLSDLKSAGIRVAVLSNTNAVHWEKLTNPANFPNISLADKLVASHLLGASKPGDECFRRFEKEVPGECYLLFDDTLVNVESAKEYGWNSHWVDPTGDQANQMRSILILEGILPTSQ